MALSTTDAARLATLQTAYDQLIAGSRVAKVISGGGRTVEYAQGDIGRLKSEIDELLSVQASSCGTVRRRGALRFSVR